MVDRTHRELTDEEVSRIAGMYHFGADQNPFVLTGEDRDGGEYTDIPGFCKSATLDDIRKHGHVSRPAAMWAQKRKRTTASRSRRR